MGQTWLKTDEIKALSSDVMTGCHTKDSGEEKEAEMEDKQAGISGGVPAAWNQTSQSDPKTEMKAKRSHTKQKQETPNASTEQNKMNRSSLNRNRERWSCVVTGTLSWREPP